MLSYGDLNGKLPGFLDFDKDTKFTITGEEFMLPFEPTEIEKLQKQVKEQHKQIEKQLKEQQKQIEEIQKYLEKQVKEQ